MKLGFNTAIVPELSFEEVLKFAARHGFSCVEVCCWPPGKAERRYAGVTHIDVVSLGHDEIKRIRDLVAEHGVFISSLGYYPNVLQADRAEAEREITHCRKVIDASAALGVNTVTTFVGRDPSLSVDDNWPRFLEVWKPLVNHAETRGSRSASRTARCSSAETSGPAARTWRPPRPSGDGCSTTSPARTSA